MTSISKRVVAAAIVAGTLIGSSAVVSAPAFAGDDKKPHATNPHHK